MPAKARPYDPRRSTSARRRYRDAAKKVWRENGGVCYFCKEPLDLSIPWPDDMSFTAHHVDAIGAGGRVDGHTEPAHNICNRKAGMHGIGDLGPTSREWSPVVHKVWEASPTV